MPTMFCPPPHAGAHGALFVALCGYAEQVAGLPTQPESDGGSLRATWSATTYDDDFLPLSLHQKLALQARFQACFSGFTPPAHVAAFVSTAAQGRGIARFELYINKQRCWRFIDEPSASKAERCWQFIGVTASPNPSVFENRLTPEALATLAEGCPPLPCTPQPSPDHQHTW